MSKKNGKKKTRSHSKGSGANRNSIYGTVNLLQQENEKLKDELLIKEEYIQTLHDQLSQERTIGEDSSYKLTSLADSFSNMKSLYDNLSLQYQKSQENKNQLTAIVESLDTDK